MMSINFEEPMNNEIVEMVKKLFGNDIKHMDDKKVLLNRLELHSGIMNNLANTAKQVVTLELNEEGDIKIMSDGTKYKVTQRGWEKCNTIKCRAPRGRVD